MCHASVALAVLLSFGADSASMSRPNVLWISCEDISPDLGCYGDTYAVTPHLDRLAAQGVRFTHCFTHAGVCAPSRSGLITGMYPTSIGTHHMRCQGVPPAEVRCFSEYLRAAGYYCTNNVKTDYQFAAPVSAWDENSNQADWRSRPPGQPFFCVINLTTTHESQIRSPSAATVRLVAALTAAERHDPARAVVPPYYPDTPLVRRDLANYYDNITAMDRQVGEILARLEADGLAEETIVWFWSDHGRGLPRCKRWLYDSGTRVPLIIRIPEKWRSLAKPRDPSAAGPGRVCEDLVAFVDFAPTMLSLAGVPIPPHFQGQAFLGPLARPPREYVYGHRDRMDEAYDLIRSVRDRRYHYFRNYLPDVSYGQDIAYMNEMPTMQELRRLQREGALTGPPALYFRPTKPVEELFDTESDPHELHNLADDPQHRETLLRLRAECERWMTSVGDVGLIPEPEFDELQRPGGEWSSTAPPLVREDVSAEQGRRITLTAQTPGSSLVYALSDGGDDKLSWHLYTEPFTAASGRLVQARAVRLGFRDSPVVRWTVGEPPHASPRAEAAAPHWREKLAESPLLGRLRELLAAQLLSEQAARPIWRQALESDHASVRYWAVRSSRSSKVFQDDAENFRERLTRLRDADPSPAVRIVAAHALAAAGDVEPSLRVLASFLRQHPHPSVRLHAATALRDLGEAARPVLSDLEAAMGTGEYVSRVATAAIRQLKPAP